MKTICPDHNVPLCRLPIMYGLPYPDEKDDNVISGGCCVGNDSPVFGYRCPVGREEYCLKDGRLLLVKEVVND